jgi:signal transduction histidine kinase
MYFGYASYINTKFYRSHSNFVLGGIGLGIIYGVLHLISPFIPNIAARYSSPELISYRIITIFTFVAAPLKLALLYFAFRITTLENQTLIKLRSKLRESVDNRKIFFSRNGILEALKQAFGADAVKLYIKIPSMSEAAEERQVHVYSSSEAPHEYESKSESKTPLPAILETLAEEQERANRRHETESRGSSPLNRIFQAARTRRTRAPFDGTEPIRHHGGLIGCLKIEKNLKIEKKETRKFTYSAAKLCQILGEDISPLVQSYRLQESLRVLVQESLRVLVEGLDKNLATPAQKDQRRRSFINLTREKFEAVIQQVLSPQMTSFVIDTGFVHTGVPEVACAEDRKRVPYECKADEVHAGLSIGHIYLDYQQDRDPLENPSLGYFHAYGKVVTSIVTRFFISSVEQRFNQIIKELSFKLTTKQTLDELFDNIQKSVEAADLAGVVLYHPEILGFRQIIRSNDTADNKAVGEKLADPQKVLRQLEDSQPKVVAVTPDRLILGMRLKLPLTYSDLPAGLFVGVRRAEFAQELGRNTPWRNFLINLADVAGSALDRIIKAEQIQREKRERAEEYKVFETAEMVNFLTHELINRVETLASSAALLRYGITKLDLDDALKKPIEPRVEDIRREFNQLRSLMEDIHKSARVPAESGPCFLEKTVQGAAELYKTGSNIEIKIEIPSAIQVKLPEFIIKLTFGNLIRNAIAAIKRREKDSGHRGGRSNGQPLISIWAEGGEENFINCFIKDTGAGVPPSLGESIFDLNVSTMQGKGGWGLFYVKRTLERNGGLIELTHSEPGDTTFRVRLPKFSE